MVIKLGEGQTIQAEYESNAARRSERDESRILLLSEEVNDGSA